MRTETFSTHGPITLEIRIPAGSVEIEAAATAETVVELDAKDKGRRAVEDALIELRGDRLVIDVSNDKRLWGISVSFGGDFRLRVRCPHHSNVQVKTGAADVEADGELGSVEIQSGSSDVTLQAAAELEVKTASGDVEVSRVHGDARVNTASGDVELGTVMGDVHARLVSGDFSIEEAHGDLSVTTVSGDQEVGAVFEGEVTLNSVSGDISVRVAQGSRLWIDAKSVSGDMSSDFELGDRPPSDDGPLVELHAKTVSGDLQVGRTAARNPNPM